MQIMQMVDALQGRDTPAARAGTGPGGGYAGNADDHPPNHSVGLFMPQGFYGVQAGGLQGREVAKDHSHGG